MVSSSTSPGIHFWVVSSWVARRRILFIEGDCIFGKCIKVYTLPDISGRAPSTILISYTNFPYFQSRHRFEQYLFYQNAIIGSGRSGETNELSYLPPGAALCENKWAQTPRKSAHQEIYTPTEHWGYERNEERGECAMQLAARQSRRCSFLIWRQI